MRIQMLRFCGRYRIGGIFWYIWSHVIGGRWVL